MRAYPLIIEPDGDEVMAHFPDVPGAGQKFHCSACAIQACVPMLHAALSAIFLEGKPMPLPSAIESGQVAIMAPIFW